jgi:hypothetical protein
VCRHCIVLAALGQTTPMLTLEAHQCTSMLRYKNETIIFSTRILHVIMMFVVLYQCFIQIFYFCRNARAHTYNNITHMYISYRVIIRFRCNARALT